MSICNKLGPKYFGNRRHRCELGVSKPQISPAHPSRRGPGPLSNTMFLGTTRVSLPNGISNKSSGFSRVHEYDRRPTYRRTDHATVTFSAMPAETLRIRKREKPVFNRFIILSSWRDLRTEKNCAALTTITARVFRICWSQFILEFERLHKELD